jgi:hypothetical protein
LENNSPLRCKEQSRFGKNRRPRNLLAAHKRNVATTPMQ